MKYGQSLIKLYNHDTFRCEKLDGLFQKIEEMGMKATGKLFLYKPSSGLGWHTHLNSTDNFTEQPKVINGASDIISSIFGDVGKHTRAAISTNSLPLGVAVEVDAIFELN